MSKFMITTSLMLFWAFYEMSGGADFAPPQRDVAVAEVTPQIEEPAPLIEVAEIAPTNATPVVQAAYEVIPAPAYEVIPAPVETATVTPAAVDEATFSDLRLVSGDWVNMRDGPSTAYRVLETLPRGTKAEIIDVNTDGWAQIRLTGSGKTGWMAERLLSDG